MNLDQPQRMSAREQKKLASAMGGICLKFACGGDNARICRRLAPGAVTVQVQCLKCGTSICALNRDEVYFWQSLPEWDDGLVTAWNTRLRALLTDADQRRAYDQHELRQQRSAEYADWLRTSHAWMTLRDRVKKRADFICEGCLGQRATQVHHLTYRLGLLPPAWELRAVCDECHQRLHNWSAP